MQDGALIGGGATAAGAVATESGGGPALRVGVLEEPAHEAEAGLADVGTAGEHVEYGVDGAAEVGEGRDIGTARRSSLDQCVTAL